MANGMESKNVPRVDAVKGTTLCGVWVAFWALITAIAFLRPCTRQLGRALGALCGLYSDISQRLGSPKGMGDEFVSLRGERQRWLRWRPRLLLFLTRPLLATAVCHRQDCFAPGDGQQVGVGASRVGGYKRPTNIAMLSTSPLQINRPGTADARRY